MASRTVRKLQAFAVSIHRIIPHKRHMICRAYSLTGNPTADRALSVVSGGRAEGWLSAYENFVGLTDVREAQSRVLEAEQNVSTVQIERRKKQTELREVQAKLRSLSAELEKVHRGEDRYLALLTEEHAIIRDETRLQEEINLLEEEERTHFTTLSSAVRDSHEKERARAERTKYWSVIGSIIGAAIGIIGTSLNNYLRMAELRRLVSSSTEGGMETRSLVKELSETMETQHGQLRTFINELQAHVGVKSDGPPVSSAAGTMEILNLVQKQNATLQRDTKEIKELLMSLQIAETEGKGRADSPLLRSLPLKTEDSLDQKMMLRAFGFVLTLPLFCIILSKLS